MITITNKKEKIIIDEKDLKKDKKNLNYLGKDKYCEIVISFVYGTKYFKKGITKIQKCQSSAGSMAGDVIKEYKNQVFNENEIVLNDKDYNEIKFLLKNMNISLEKQLKEVIVESTAIMMAFEIFRYDRIDDFDYDDDFNVILEYVCCERLYYPEKIKYKNDIIKRAKEVLKEKYNGGKE